MALGDGPAFAALDDSKARQLDMLFAKQLRVPASKAKAVPTGDTPEDQDER